MSDTAAARAALVDEVLDQVNDDTVTAIVAAATREAGATRADLLAASACLLATVLHGAPDRPLIRIAHHAMTDTLLNSMPKTPPAPEARQ